MTKTKSTKRALLLSALSLLMCVSMLIGSTFAWFTDSVTSSGNIIKSGTLEIEMLWKDATTNGKQTDYKDASAGPIFDYDLWEPGYVEAKNIEIKNVGTLDLKYQLSIVATGEVSKLADVIDVYYADGEKVLDERADMSELTYIGTLSSVLAQVSTTASGNLLDGESHKVTLALKMKESAGNDYQGLSIGSEFAVKLMATQLTSEVDSFDNQYDKMATIDDVAELKAALAEKSVEIVFGSDIVLEETLTIAADQEVLFNLNGHKLSGVSTASGTSTYMIEVDGDLTVENGTVTTQHTGTDLAWDYCTAAFHMDFDGKLTIKDATVENLGGTSMAYAIDITNVYAGDDSQLTIDNSTVKSTYIAVRVFNNGSGVHNVKITNSVLAGKYAFWVQYYADGDFSSAEEANTRRNNLNIDIYGNNNTFVGAEDKVSPILYGYDECTYFDENGEAFVTTAELFEDALAKGGEVVLYDDIELDETLMTTKDVVIDLNGNTLTTSSDYVFQSQSNAKSNITITSSADGAAINVSGGDTAILLGYGSTEISNVTINVTGCDNYSPNPFNVHGNLILGKGTVVNIDYLGTALISNSGAVDIVIDGAEFNIGTFKTNGTAVITLNKTTNLEIKNTEMKINNFVLSQFGGESLVDKADGVTIENCTFDVTDSNGARCTFVAKDGKYRLVQQ